jgi:hypothetical protein
MVSFQRHVHSLTTNIVHSHDLISENSTKMNLEQILRSSFLLRLPLLIFFNSSISDVGFNF